MKVAAKLTQPEINLGNPVVEWSDSNLVGGHKYNYRLTAVDTSGNESAPTRMYSAIAVDTSVPPAPLWIEQAWLLQREADASLIAWADDEVVPAGYAPVLRLGWQCETPEPEFVVARLISGETVWTELTNARLQTSPTDAISFLLFDFEANPLSDSAYRLKVRSSSGVWSTEESIVSVTAKELSGG